MAKKVNTMLGLDEPFLAETKFKEGDIITNGETMVVIRGFGEALYNIWEKDEETRRVYICSTFVKKDKTFSLIGLELPIKMIDETGKLVKGKERKEYMKNYHKLLETIRSANNKMKEEAEKKNKTTI